MRGRVDEYEIIADGLSRQVQVGLAGGVAALYPQGLGKVMRCLVRPTSPWGVRSRSVVMLRVRIRG